MAAIEAMDTSSANGARTVGVVVAERLYAGVMTDGVLTGPLLSYPESDVPGDNEEENPLVELHTDALVDAICQITLQAVDGDHTNLTAVGIALPGLIRGGVVEEAPNLPQLKGARIAELLEQRFSARGFGAAVVVSNDADAMAAGLASKVGKLDRRYRVWTLGTGIGYGCYPLTEGVWEGGHTTVSLDDRENYCGCGGKGHLEGIMGHRAMRLRFLDMEPEEVFAAATRRENQDPRCCDFRNLWHRALAAATASSIHMSGAGKFFFTGYNVRFLDLKLLRTYLDEMIKMSPLQSSQLEIVPDDQAVRAVGAGVIAEQAACAATAS